MLLDKYESEFLTDLSDDQQEQVSGGSGGSDKTFGLSTTNFHLFQLAKVSGITTQSASGPGGSVAGGAAVKQLSLAHLNTSGLNLVVL